MLAPRIEVPDPEKIAERRVSDLQGGIEGVVAWRGVMDWAAELEVEGVEPWWWEAQGVWWLVAEPEVGGALRHSPVASPSYLRSVSSPADQLTPRIAVADSVRMVAECWMSDCQEKVEGVAILQQRGAAELEIWRQEGGMWVR